MSRIIVISIVKNEAKRFLKRWLDNVQTYADAHLIIDDGSDCVETIQILKEYQNNYEDKVEVIFNENSRFEKEETSLRKQLWDSLLKSKFKPEEEKDWIFVVDADEFYYDDLKKRKVELLNLPKRYNVVMFRLLDVWDKESRSAYYRTDGFWSPYFHRMFRFKELPFNVSGSGLHHPSVPSYALNDKEVFPSDIRCFHLGYSTEELRQEKYNWYIDKTDGINLQHAKSIIEEPFLSSTLLKEKELPHIVIGSLVKDREWILPDYLKCIDAIDYPKEKISYIFIINNSSDRSFDILHQWSQGKNVHLMEHNFKLTEPHGEHKWNHQLLDEMANMRDCLKDEAFELLRWNDYLISIDTDILFPPGVIKHLVMSDKEIISPVFWAGWHDGKYDTQKLPQVWINGGYHLTNDFVQFVANSRRVFEVGGLGAFTAIKKTLNTTNPALNYQNVDFMPHGMEGEDRNFCMRASVLGIKRFASTYYDLLHIDNPQQLNEIKDKKAKLKT